MLGAFCQGSVTPVKLFSSLHNCASKAEPVRCTVKKPTLNEVEVARCGKHPGRIF